MFAISAVYAGLLGLMLVGLSVPVMLTRRRLGIALGDGGDARMLRLMRMQANFAEYAPIGLLLLFALEGLAAAPWVLHVHGVGLVAGRIAHAYGFGRESAPSAGRIAGMALTWTTIFSAASVTLGLAFTH